VQSREKAKHTFSRACKACKLSASAGTSSSGDPASTEARSQTYWNTDAALRSRMGELFLAKISVQRLEYEEKSSKHKTKKRPKEVHD